MGSLSKFLGKPKEIDIEGDKLTIHPLKVEDMHLFSAKENASQEELNKVSTKMLKLSIPDATDEEINSLPMAKFMIIMEAINKLNGFTDERLDAIRKRIEQRKAGG